MGKPFESQPLPHSVPQASGSKGERNVPIRSGTIMEYQCINPGQNGRKTDSTKPWGKRSKHKQRKAGKTQIQTKRRGVVIQTRHSEAVQEKSVKAIKKSIARCLLALAVSALPHAIDPRDNAIPKVT